MNMGFGRYSLAGSMIGGIAETQEMIDFCTARGIKAEIELIQANYMDQAFQRVVNKEVRYRFVIDMQKSQVVGWGDSPMTAFHLRRRRPRLTTNAAIDQLKKHSSKSPMGPPRDPGAS